MKIHELDKNTKVSDVTTNGGKPKKGAPDPLGEMRKHLGQMKSTLQKRQVGDLRDCLAGIRGDIQDFVMDVAAQAAEVLGDEQATYLSEHYKGLGEMVRKLVADAREKSPQAGDDLAFAYLVEAWKQAPKTSLSVAYLVSDALLLNLCELQTKEQAEKKEKGFNLLALWDRSKNTLGSARVRFQRHPSFGATLEEMRVAQQAYWNEKNAQQAEAEQELWNAAETTNLLAALGSATPVKVAFELPSGRQKTVGLVEFADGYIKPLHGAGKDGWLFRLGKKQGVLIKTESLSNSQPTVPERLDARAWKTACNLHTLLRRAVDKAKYEAEFQAALANFREEQDSLSEKEFYAGVKSGTHTVYHPTWSVKTKDGRGKPFWKKFWRVVLTVTRNKGGELTCKSAELGESKELMAFEPFANDENGLERFVGAAQTHWQNCHAGESVSDKANDGEELAREREAEIQAELEAKREAMAQAEAKRIANQHAQTE